MFVRFFRFLKGLVEFKVSGGFSERFLNLCNVNGLPLWNVSKKGNELHATTDIKSYKQMHTFACRTGSVVRMTKKSGAPFLLHRYKHRVGILVGLLVFVVAIAVLTSFVWSVEVEGNKALKSEEIISFYEKIGVKKGARASSFDLKNLESAGMAEFPEISWVSINTYGSKVVIEIREAIIAPERVEKEKPCNIVAERDGLIVKMEVYAGFPLLNEGDSVAQGDMIVSGVSESMVTKDTFYKRSSAKVIARRTREISVNVASNEEVRTFTEKVKKRNYINFFNIKIPLYFGKEPEGQFQLESNDKDFEVAKTVLPISFHKRIYRQFEITEKTLDLQQMTEKGEADIREKLKHVKGLEKCESEEFDITQTENGLTVTGRFVTLEEIGQQQEIQIEKLDE